MSRFKELFQKLSLYTATTVIVASYLSNVVSAQFNPFYMDSVIPFYDASASLANSPCSGTSVTGDTNIHKIWNYLVGEGLTDMQAAGILGNIQEESGFSATRQQDGIRFPRGGWGLVQWDADGGRRTPLIQALTEFDPSLTQYHAVEFGGPTSASTGYVAEGIPEADADKLLGFQLDYLYDEAQLRMTHGFPEYRGLSEWEAIKQTTTIRESSDIWLVSFERPADQSEAHKQVRANHGQEIYDMIMGDRSGLESGGSCVGGSVNDLQALTLEYAHPQYHRAPYTEKRPAYAQAVQQAIAADKYVGSRMIDGVDCGGFVTLLIINSGFDPTYNHNGDLPAAGNTTTQEAWLKSNWTALNPNEVMDTSRLEPGDVAMIPGHTWLFVGDIPGFDSQAASASQDERAPMAAAESSDYQERMGVSYEVKWYRR